MSKHPGGRPTKYNPRYIEEAQRLCSLGLTELQISHFFRVTEATFNAWKKRHPEFLKALKNGKTVSDNEVEVALFKRACGYSHPEDKIFLYEGEEIIIPTIKRYPPDTVACIFWLKNRKPAEWRDKVENEVSLPGMLTDLQLHLNTRSKQLSIPQSEPILDDSEPETSEQETDDNSNSDGTDEHSTASS